jgi:hypothetical protein
LMGTRIPREPRDLLQKNVVIAFSKKPEAISWG